MNRKITYRIKRACVFVFSVFSFIQLYAQTDVDGIMMTKNNLCIGATYNYSSWTNYWEGPGAASTILGYIIRSKATMFNDMANEVSISRLYGAIHYRSD